MKKLSILLFALFLCFTVSHATSPTLTVTGDGTPESTVYLDVTDATAGAVMALFVSMKTEGMLFKTPFGDIQFDIGFPAIPIGRGYVDENGEFSLAFDLPDFPPKFAGKELYFQGVEAVITHDPPGRPEIVFTTTNVDSLILAE